MLTIETQEQAKSLFSLYKTFLFDLDGVIWSGSHVIPGALEMLQQLRRADKGLIFVTNNASKSRMDVVNRFAKMGFEVHPDEVFTSSYAAAYYLASWVRIPAEKPVYVIGMEGLMHELREAGLNPVGGPEDADGLADLAALEAVEAVPDAVAVVIGFDLHFNYRKICKAHMTLEENPEAIYLMCNHDATFPAFGKIYPGAGSMAQTLVNSTKRKPVVTGKPHPILMELIMRRHNLNPAECIMIGDRLDTDIAFGRQAGLSTLLVLSGVAKAKDVHNAKHRPDFLAPSVGHIADLL